MDVYPMDEYEDVNTVISTDDKIPDNQRESMIDPLVRARHVWRKGRHEHMGGPINYEQGNGIPGYENNERHCRYPTQFMLEDPIAHDLGVDTQES